MPWESLFDGAGRDAPLEVPLWSGLRLTALAQVPGHAAPPPQRLPLKDLETELIRRAVQDARGNVMQAAQSLGISRATVYRKLGHRKPGG
jgi:transcriptional regulator of acetoin/glycerol metabolism